MDSPCRRSTRWPRRFSPGTWTRPSSLLNALLGLGTALAPVFVAIFVGLGIWWGLPVLVGLLLLGLLFLSLSESLNEGESSHAGQTQKGKFPMRFWIFAAFVLLLRRVRNHERQLGFALPEEAFWREHSDGVARPDHLLEHGHGGTCACSPSSKSGFPNDWFAALLPFVVTAAFMLSAWRAENQFVARHPDFCPGRTRLFGACCPLPSVLARRQLTTIAASVAGGLIAFYQIGYGIAAFGVGPLQTWAGLDLSAIYGGTAVVALAMAALSFVVTRKSAAPA